MTRNSETNWLARVWTAWTEASAAAVAIQYAAPWHGSATASRPARDYGSCPA